MPQIVGVGASAGGIQAFKEFFEAMPADQGFSVVVVLHLPADRPSMLADILRRWTAMPVVNVSHGCAVLPNHVYVPPPGAVVTYAGGCLHLRVAGTGAQPELATIDTFFNSLATALNQAAIGIVLSGTGSDGTLGLKAIKACGGLTIVQGTDGTAPEYSDMPASAITAGVVDIVAAAGAIPGHLLTTQHIARVAVSKGLDLSVEQTRAARLAICAIVKREIGHDFSSYKEKTFLRRVQRRMQVLGAASLDEYVDRLEANLAEVALLFKDLLIGVTSFFRDVETFDMLRQRVVPRLFAGKSANDVVRVWVPGCATGEEAYSLAILFCEHVAGFAGAPPKIQIFATDIDESAISVARLGRYPSALVQGISPERLERFFVKGGDETYCVSKQVRELCTFSAHSLTRDPPFSRINLISCRNLLIYMDTDLQAAVFPVFHYSLVPDGMLLLGSSETISRHDNLFTTIDRGHRIFQRQNAPSPPLQLTGKVGLGKAPSFVGGPISQSNALRAGASRMDNRANNRILERFSPAFVVVNGDGDITQYSNRIGRFLEPAVGLPSQNVLLMARQGLRLHIRLGLKQVAESGRPIENTAVAVELPGEGLKRVTLVIEPLSSSGGAPLYLIVFIEGQQDGPDGLVEPGSVIIDSSHDRQLEAELRDTREQLQAITEEHETALEELRSANEELHSVNEELQSTNEELETSKEEIQSINEELQTVNSQLASKVDELDLKNSDLKNLFESTRVATIFLDPYLIVRAFTPAIADIYNLIPSDQGRPLTDIVSHLAYRGLREDVRAVLSTLNPLERRVAREDGRAHYLMRILPYRAPDSTVDGTIVTFVDVTSIVQGEQQQRLLVDELNHRVRNMLTVVISLANQTMRRSTTMAEFSENYIGRIHALTAAYSLLSKESWQSVPLHEVITEEIRPFITEDRPNITLSGPHVPLSPRAALALGMAIHELTTNAVKYGALSVVEGSVSISWTTERNSEWLALEWIEQQGPPVNAPESKGLGLIMIERGLKQDMSADVDVDFAVDGVKARITAPLSALSEEA